MSDEPFRYELNRKVRNILVSHNADMTKVSYSSSNKTVSIYGVLLNHDHKDFNISTLRVLVSELMNIPGVSFNFALDNWIIVAEPGDLTIIKGRRFEPLLWGKDKDEL